LCLIDAICNSERAFTITLFCSFSCSLRSVLAQIISARVLNCI
jgi:hypothetical protein